MKRLFPLEWPANQRRTLSPVGWPPAGAKVDAMREPAERLAKALDLRGFEDVELSTNVRVGPTGLYLAKSADDAGAALSFTFKGNRYHVGQDAWSQPYFNVWSLALMAEGLRQTVRHAGDALFERMISGLAALPPPRLPHEILGVEPYASPTEIRAAFREAARRAHPDAGGSHARMAELSAARDAMLRPDPQP